MTSTGDSVGVPPIWVQSRGRGARTACFLGGSSFVWPLSPAAAAAGGSSVDMVNCLREVVKKIYDLS